MHRTLLRTRLRKRNKTVRDKRKWRRARAEIIASWHLITALTSRWKGTRKKTIKNLGFIGSRVCKGRRRTQTSRGNIHTRICGIKETNSPASAQLLLGYRRNPKQAQSCSALPFPSLAPVSSLSVRARARPPSPLWSCRSWTCQTSTPTRSSSRRPGTSEPSTCSPRMLTNNSRQIKKPSSNHPSKENTRIKGWSILSS